MHCSPCAFGQSLYRVLTREIKQECTLAVMHRLTLCENVDSAKIKVPFYITDIDILCVASMHRIDIPMNRFTPSIKLTAHLCSRPHAHVLIYRKYIACAMNIKT